LGRAYRQARDYDNAVRWYSAAADQGYAGAQNSLGVMYSRGEGVVENCTTAAHLFELAAAQAYPAAIRNLGTLSCVRLV
jgi:TPR repeat protein